MASNKQNTNKEQCSDRFLEQSRELLDNSVEKLDADVKDKLYNMRRKIIMQQQNNTVKAAKSSRLKGLFPVAGLALAASVILGIFMQAGLWQSEFIVPDTDMELVSTLDNIELYEDLDFYQWLADNPTQAG